MNRLAALLVVAAVVVVSGCSTPPAKDYASFTTCITDAGVQEYGAYWCPNCARVKVTLGDAWNNLDYVECDPKCTGDPLPAYCNGHASQTDKCLQLGIDKYPSWVKGSNILYVGTDLEQVAQVTSCTLPV